MKSQLFKLYAAALIIGIMAVGSAFAQQNNSFEVPFDFQVSGEKLDAGKYELLRLDNAKYILRNTETKDQIILVTIAPVGFERSVKSEHLVFNRFGETYFLREIYARAGTVGRALSESKPERQFRRKFKEKNPQLAKNAEQVSISSTQ